MIESENFWKANEDLEKMIVKFKGLKNQKIICNVCSGVMTEKHYYEIHSKLCSGKIIHPKDLGL